MLFVTFADGKLHWRRHTIKQKKGKNKNIFKFAIFTIVFTMIGIVKINVKKVNNKQLAQIKIIATSRNTVAMLSKAL